MRATLLFSFLLLTACADRAATTSSDGGSVEAGASDAGSSDASGDAASPFRRAFKLPPVSDPDGHSCLWDVHNPPQVSGIGHDHSDHVPQSFFFHEIATRCRHLHPELAAAADNSANLTEPERARVLFRAARASEGWDFRCAITENDADQAFMYVWPRLQATNDTRAVEDQCLVPAMSNACSYDVGTWAFLKTLGMLEDSRKYHDQENQPTIVHLQWLTALQGLASADNPRDRCPHGLPTDATARVPMGFVPPPTDTRKRQRKDGPIPPNTNPWW